MTAKQFIGLILMLTGFISFIFQLTNNNIYICLYIVGFMHGGLLISKGSSETKKEVKKARRIDWIDIWFGFLQILICLLVVGIGLACLIIGDNKEWYLLMFLGCFFVFLGFLPFHFLFGHEK